MDPSTAVLLGGLMFVAALLYASVGHAGASGYLAVMSLAELAPTTMKPTAAALNIVVSVVGTIQFARAGYFRWQLFWPFAVVSIPAAYLGGGIELPSQYYKPLVGVVLLWAAARMLFAGKAATFETTRTIALPVALGVGAAIGFLSGLTGVGGGIFLSPVLILMHWAKIRDAAGVSVAFILVNSIAGLIGQWKNTAHIPAEIVYWAPAVLLGGAIGAELGSRRINVIWLRRILGVVLIMAGGKMFIPDKPSKPPVELPQNVHEIENSNRSEAK